MSSGESWSAREEGAVGSRRWPWHGWAGLGLIVVFWVLNWSLTGLRTHWGFFPLWLGYSLTVDALVLWRKGTSLLTRNRTAYVRVFIHPKAKALNAAYTITIRRR